MKSVFQKLLKKELGYKSYNQYFSYVHENMKNKSLEGKFVYEDIYKRLEGKDIETISKMHNRLNDAMLHALQISRTYMLSFFVYLGASFFIILKALVPVVTILALILLSIVFVWRTYVYVVNKYCYVDAQIVIVYKSVLEKILVRHIQTK